METTAKRGWGPWEHDKYEPDLYVRHRINADGYEVSDSLGLDYLNALEAAAEALTGVTPVAWLGASAATAEGFAGVQERCEQADAALARLRELRV